MQISRFPVLSLPLKSAILAGTITISAAAGIFTIIGHGNVLFKSLENRYEQIRDFYQTEILPPLVTHFNSLSSIFHRYGEWYGYLRENREYIQSILDIRNFPEGYRKMGNRIHEWYEEIIILLRLIFKDMNESFLRSMVRKLFLTASIIPGMLTVFKNFLENLISQKLEMLPEDFPAFLKNTWNLFAENTKIIEELEEGDYNTIFNYMSEKPQEFSEKIKDLKEKAKSSPNEPGKWGNYNNKQEFLREVLPKDKAAKLLLARISSAYMSCSPSPNRNSSCWRKYASLDDLKEFIALKNNGEILEKLRNSQENFEFTPKSSPEQ